MKTSIWIITLLIGTSYALQFAALDCPSGWSDFNEYCYRFDTDTEADIDGAKTLCQEDGAFVLSVHSREEDNFLVEQLDIYDPGQTKRDWWTSGRRVSDQESMEFYWEGDGRPIESFINWHNNSIPQQRGKNRILYHYDGFKWAWILGTGMELRVFICKILKDNIYMINMEERGPDYGLDNPDPSTIPRGPAITQQPTDYVYETVQEGMGVVQAYFECMADSYPESFYHWFKSGSGEEEQIDPIEETRYTMVNGRLIIDQPAIEKDDAATYRCSATNDYGTVLSSSAQLSFGYMLEFPSTPRAPVQAYAYGFATIDCQPPSNYPSVNYNWFKDSINNFVRPDVKPYIFISNDGRLYFSEVTSYDSGNYVCILNKPGMTYTGTMESEPIELRVLEASAGEHEPEIGTGFPAIFPEDPKAGDDIRIECWAKGTSQPEYLQYYWDRILLNEQGEYDRATQMPQQAYLIDHNRVINIPNAQLYDKGHYRCRVDRVNGESASKTVELSLRAEPYFVLELGDRFVDEGSALLWKCEAGGDPTPSYTWLKNGLDLLSNIPPEEADRITISNNVLNISSVDSTKDQGMYQCAASNTLSTQYSSGELRVLSFTPTFVKYPLQANQLATKEGNTTMICRPEAAPAPDIFWYKDGLPLNPGTEEGSRVLQLPNGNIFISPVVQGDEGRYICQATNSLGVATSTGNLTILDTMTISYISTETTVTVNKTTFLHCMASYNPLLDVTYVWYHGDILVEFEIIYRLGENRYEVWTDPHFKRGEGLYEGGLYIMHVQWEHAGVYTCVVDSSTSSMEGTIELNVIGPPSEPAGVYLDSNTITNVSTVIYWKVGGDNGEDIVSFVVETLNYWQGFWKIQETNVWDTPDLTETYTYTVTGLHPYSEYQLRMRAENSLGTSDPCTPSDVFQTKSVTPDKAPQNLGGGGGKVGVLTINWTPLEPWEHNGEGIGYNVYWKRTGNADWNEPEEIVGSVGEHVILIGALEQNAAESYYKEYDVAVEAYNVIGRGPRSPTVTIRSSMSLPPSRATDVKAIPFNSTAVVVTWIPVQDTVEEVRGKLGGYRLGFWPYTDGPEVENPERVTINGQATQGLVIGLDPNTYYYFNVYVWNEAGNGPPSEWIIQRSLRHAPINQPVEVALEHMGGNSIYVKWRGVSTALLEEPLEGYMVRIWRQGEDIKVATDYDAGKDTELLVEGLGSYITYKLRVYGYSRGGQGTMSSPAIIFTIAAGSCVTYSLFTMLLAIVCSLALHTS